MIRLINELLVNRFLWTITINNNHVIVAFIPFPFHKTVRKIGQFFIIPGE